MKKTTLAILSFAIAAVAAIGFQNVIIRGDVVQEAVIIRGDTLDNTEQLAVIIRGDDLSLTDNGKVLPNRKGVIIRGGLRHV